MKIDYDHFTAPHPIATPRAALATIFNDKLPQNLLDIGCGQGTWLKVAQELGVKDVFGVDGVAIPASELLFSEAFFRQHDLSKPLNLGRKFEFAICLEVGEHLPEEAAFVLINSLAKHSDTILFSAAAPGQEGQNHINCQWPNYWQKKFNQCGFACTDEVRWKIWADERIEPWYRQNPFIARRDPGRAGSETPIAPVIHPDCFQTMTNGRLHEYANKIQAGGMPMKWYIKALFTASCLRFRKRNKS